MLCADTNCWIRYWAGERGWDTDQMDAALAEKRLALAPMVISELLSAPDMPEVQAQALRRLPILEIKAGYWERAGRLRAHMYRAGYRPKMLDTFIALICLDNDVPLLTLDRGFEGFAKVVGLKLRR